jgi:IclR family transcriptional regulator, KDG regulon repressor
MRNNTIQSVTRAIRILKLFSLEQPRWGISEIARGLKLHKGTVQGLVRTLTAEGFLQKNLDTQKYHLGLGIYGLHTILSGSLEINQKAGQPAQKLARRVRHLVRIAIPDEDSILVTLDAYPRPQPFFSPPLRPRSPYYCTALGKAVLAFLEADQLKAYLQRVRFVPFTPNTITQEEKLLKQIDEIRRAGYATNQEEQIIGWSAIAAPIFNSASIPVAAICVVVQPRNMNKKTEERLAMHVISTSREISQVMGFPYTQ